MAGRTVPAHHRCEFTCKGFLASAWGQRGSHQLAGRTGGEHVSAADPVTYPMGRVPQEVGPTRCRASTSTRESESFTGIRELHRRWGPPLSTISGLTRRQLPHTWWGVPKAIAMTRVMVPATPQVVGHTMPPRLSRMFDAQHLRASRRFCFSSRGVYCFPSPCGVVRVSGWFCGGVVLPFFFGLAMDMVCLQCVAA